MSPLRLHTVEIYSADFLFLFSPKSENLKQWQQVKDHVVRDGKLRPNCSLRILHVCSASTRKSFQGLDYVSCSGVQAFEDLVNVVHQLGENGMGLTWAKIQKEALKEAKRYLKTDFKVK